MDTKKNEMVKNLAMVGRAAACCRDIHNDFTKEEVDKMPACVQAAWCAGETLNDWHKAHKDKKNELAEK